MQVSEFDFMSVKVFIDSETIHSSISRFISYSSTTFSLFTVDNQGRGQIIKSKKLRLDTISGDNKGGGEQTVIEATSRVKIDRIIYLLVCLFDDTPPISYEAVKELIEASLRARDHEFTADRAHKEGGVFGPQSSCW
jgi:hypothetical protein